MDSNKTNGKTETKGNGVPGLSAGSFMIVSWTIAVVSLVVGFCIAIKIFPNGFKNGELNGIGIPATVLVTVLGGQFLFWHFWKKGWKSNAA
jgi:hypothetical protein